jgi:hypothetical protein
MGSASSGIWQSTFRTPLRSTAALFHPLSGNLFFTRPPHPLFANLVYTKQFFVKCSRLPRTPSRQTEETTISTSGAKALRTPTALAATMDVDSAEHKQLPNRRFSIKQTAMMPIW